MKFVVENDVLVKVEVENNEKCKVVDIPEGVREIGAESFGEFLFEVEKLYIPKSVEKIDDCAFFTEIAISNDLKGKFHRCNPRLGSCSMQMHRPQVPQTYCV